MTKAQSIGPFFEKSKMNSTEMRFLACQLVVLFLAIYEPSTASAESKDVVKLFGLDSTSSVEDFKKNIEARGYTCMDRPGIGAEFTFCIDGTSANQVMSAWDAEMKDITPLLIAAATNGKLTTSQEADAAAKAFNLTASRVGQLSYVFRQQSESITTIYFSCSVFKSCGYDISDIISGLRESTKLNRLVNDVHTPTILDDLFLAVQRENYSTEQKDFLALISNHITLQPSLTPCLYAEDSEQEVCVYSGALTASIPIKFIDPPLMMESKNAVALSFGLTMPFEWIELKSRTNRNKKLNFN